jgi:hypothetical protein
VGAGARILHRVHLGDPITTLSAYPGGNVMNLAVDPQDYRRLYVVDQQNRIWASADEGASWSDLTANLHQLTNDYVGRTIGIYSTPSNPNAVLIVGAQGGVFEMPHPGQETPNWTVLGDGLPHALVLDLHYDYTDNLLVVGTLGRGAWILNNPFASGDSAGTVSGAGSDAAVITSGTSALTGGLSPVDFLSAALGLSMAASPTAMPPTSSTATPVESMDVSSLDRAFAGQTAEGPTADFSGIQPVSPGPADAASLWDTLDWSLWEALVGTVGSDLTTTGR